MSIPTILIESTAAQAVETVDTLSRVACLDKCMMPGLSSAAGITFWLFIAWMVGVVLYYWWAIRHYNLNWGLSPQEWKILHPETYCSDQKEIDQFLKRRAALEQRTGKVLVEPSSNPYEKDSFGLPPGTVRGTLALTALVGFVLVQALTMVSPTSMDNHFEELNTVFKMVMAFYFGSRALEVLEKSRKGDNSPSSSGGEQAPEGGGEGKPAVTGNPNPAPVSAPTAKDLPADVVEDGPGMPPPPTGKEPKKPV